MTKLRDPTLYTLIMPLWNHWPNENVGSEGHTLQSLQNELIVSTDRHLTYTSFQWGLLVH